jgi:hypothetical protein
MVLTQHPGLARWLVELGLVREAALPTALPQQNGVPLDYLVYAPAMAVHWAEAWERTESLLRTLRAMTAADGAMLVILVVCGREQVYPDTWAEIVAAHPAMAEMTWDLYGPERGLMAWCEAEGISCLQLSAAFRKAVDIGVPLHYRHDGHWTAAGHRLAAESLVKFLRFRGLLPE